MKITEDIKYIGVNDHEIDMFEGMYQVPGGMAYNSYMIVDEKIAIMDTVDENFTCEWLANIEKILGNRNPDYLIVHHMEPDHSANIVNLQKKYPEIVIVASEKAFVMMNHFFGSDFTEKRIAVSDGDMLSLGKHKLVFASALMVHWPEVIVTYDSTDKVLFSADGFGKFGALNVEEEWKSEARRYYFGIVGKYGISVQKLLAKLKAWDIQTICPLHGPVLSENVNYYIDLYDIWSRYQPEEEGVLIAYTSIYGNTKKAATYLAERLKEKGCAKVVMRDLSRCDISETVAEAFRYSKLVLATTTYNTMIFPFMREFISWLTERNFCNRMVGFIENGSWMPTAAKHMQEMFQNSKEIIFAEPFVKLMSALNKESCEQIEQLAEELCKK
ncbi:MAG: FprA family A-type flavoprotein [Lachnospiraceae bacterium]|nr:FprA family A-type flavoprotein [Lachnospiraceae bacterium]